MDAIEDDARRAVLDGEGGPDDPADYESLRARLNSARDQLPAVYQGALVAPLTLTLEKLGRSGYTQLLQEDPWRRGAAGCLLDLAQAALQKAERYLAPETGAFEAVVGDLHDAFVGARNRRGVIVAPVVKWGKPTLGPYTWSIDATSQFGARCAVVSLPPAQARRGVAGWAALAHETAGHDIVHADHALATELSQTVEGMLTTREMEYGLAPYWARRIDESVSDVMGILNMGPAAALGLIAYLRAVRSAFGGAPKLSSVGPANDPHPADILRGYLVAAAVGRLDLSGAEPWSSLVTEQVERDVGPIVLSGLAVPKTVAIESADIVAEVIATSRLEALGGRSLREIRSWGDVDEECVGQVSRILASAGPSETDLPSTVLPAHAVSATVLASVRENADIPGLFGRMIAVLAR